MKVIDASQDKFLLNAGLLDQLQYRLDRAETEAEKLSLTTGAREMILPGGMASSFQVVQSARSNAVSTERDSAGLISQSGFFMAVDLRYRAGVLTRWRGVSVGLTSLRSYDV